MEKIRALLKQSQSVRPFDRIFPYSIKYNIKQTSDENKEKYQLGDYKLIQHQIL